MSANHTKYSTWLITMLSSSLIPYRGQYHRNYLCSKYQRQHGSTASLYDDDNDVCVYMTTCSSKMQCSLSVLICVTSIGAIFKHFRYITSTPACSFVQWCPSILCFSIHITTWYAAPLVAYIYRTIIFSFTPIAIIFSKADESPLIEALCRAVHPNRPMLVSLII